MTKNEFMRMKLEKKLYKASILESVYAEFLIKDLVSSLDYGSHTKKQLNYYIKRLNSVRKQVANLKNELYFNDSLYRMNPTKTETLECETEADKLNSMLDEMYLKSDFVCDIPF